VGTFGVDANGKAPSGLNHKGERTDATPRGGALRSSEEVRESGWSEGGAGSEAGFVEPTRNGRSSKDQAKPYCISRQEVLEARYASGICIAVRQHPSKISPRCGTRNFADGTTTMGDLTLLRYGPSSGLSANRWFAGLVGNTRSCAVTEPRLGNGCCVSSTGSRPSWLSGHDSAVRFSPWEPYESRGSSTVLEGPRGEIPRGYLTIVRLGLRIRF
jgi:hypothetical protein